MNSISRLQIILNDGDCALIQVLATIKSTGFDYSELHCSYEGGGNYKLYIEVEKKGEDGSVNTLCEALQPMPLIHSVGIVGDRKRPEWEQSS